MYVCHALVHLTLSQIRFSFVEGAPFHENDEHRIDKQASGPHTNKHWVEKITSPI